MYYILFIIICFLLFSILSSNLHIIRISLYLCIFLLLKWIFNHNNCTFGYLECKFRNITRHQGYINNICTFLHNLFYNNPYNDLLFIFFFIICFIQFIKLLNFSFIIGIH